MWYPQNKEELKRDVNGFLNQNAKVPAKDIHGIIVPHAGYEFSGKIAGKAFSLLKEKKIKKAVIIAPSHYLALSGIITSNQKEWRTSLGAIKLFNLDFEEGDIEREHSIDNQIPFLQELGFEEILPLMVGQISNEQAKKIAEKLSGINDAILIISTDLSHFRDYADAEKEDRETIKIIENLDLEKFSKVDACGFFPLLIFFHLCKIKGWKPNLIEYKNSGDITGEKSSVVGYASFWF